MRTMGSVTVFAAAAVVVIVEGTSMLYEAFKKSQREKGQKEGRAEADAEWEEWEEARRAADRDGRPFTEPTPAERHARERISA